MEFIEQNCEVQSFVFNNLPEDGTLMPKHVAVGT
jgi:hypothetical protein